MGTYGYLSLAFLCALLVILYLVLKLRRVRSQLSLIKDVLEDMKDGNFNRRVLARESDMTRQICYDINEFAMNSQVQLIRQRRAERQKLRQSNIFWVAVFATILVAVIVFVGGRTEYLGPDSRFMGYRQIDYAGWYLGSLQSLATFFVLPAVTALLGSYMICREEQEDTLKSLRIIPVDEVKLTAAKMMITFAVCELLYLLLFLIAFGVEAVLHFSGLSADTILGSLKEYFLDGIGVFFAISPIIALVSRKKKGYWLALVFTEMYSFVGLLAGMSGTLRTFYPILAVFNFSGHYQGNVMVSVMVLLLCSLLGAILLIGPERSKKDGKQVI